MDKYKDIINIKHFEPKHERMSLYARSAQFAPFAALTGYEEQVAETGRLTDEKREIEEGLIEIINQELIKIKEIIKLNPKVKITYFVPDKRKTGGKYITKEESVKKIDEYNHLVILLDSTKVRIDDIIQLEIIK